MASVFGQAEPGANYDGPRDDYPDQEAQYVDRVRVDRYLDVEIWTNHSDGDYYVGETIDMGFRANRDAFVAIYSVDTRGRVNLLFPTSPTDDNFVYGGVAYSLPGPDVDYDLVVTGPEGVENIQIIASRERFPIPDWYGVSGLVCDWDDRHDFMDYINTHYFVRYDGQRFAFDRTAMWINEWEPYYYRPIYRPYYPSWTVSGNVYIDYPWGGTVYVDGIYWGIAPLYIPRVYVGWHSFTVYDRWGYCWENDVHVTRYNTLVLGHKVVKPRPSVMSKHKEVREVGYRNPGAHGYPKYKDKLAAASKAGVVMTDSEGRKSLRTGKSTRSAGTNAGVSVSKRHVRGTTAVVSTARGVETAGRAVSVSKRGRDKSRSTKGELRTVGNTDGSRSVGKRSQGSYGSSSSGSNSGKRISTGTKSQSKSSGYYQKKSGAKRKQSLTTGKTKVKAKSNSGDKGVSSGTKTKSKASDGGSSSSGKTKISDGSKSAPSKAAPAPRTSSSGGKKKRR
jgi:hypothetical protein